MILAHTYTLCTTYVCMHVHLSNRCYVSHCRKETANQVRRLWLVLGRHQKVMNLTHVFLCKWFIVFRDEVTAKLKDTSDGTFLVRNSQDGQGYTLTVRYHCIYKIWFALSLNVWASKWEKRVNDGMSWVSEQASGRVSESVLMFSNKCVYAWILVLHQ